ncbi:MAG: 4-(cytidine 5'-diphospho)-2-C-methyl-D-erythritol kinase [Elusimicrobiota bacterium]|jgi:4-diphosphocytidyl-2-C-methyl-D-erythritol kinase
MSGPNVQTQCPAKVNLFLEVTGRRPDGYHTLATLFAKIALFDVLDFEPAREFSLEIVDEAGQGLAAGEDNLVLRAARAFRSAFRTGAGARIRLTKRIPMGAGLGGGSSDAAGTLLGLARLYRMERKTGLMPKLRTLALGLGADVPVFLHPSPFTEGRGVGERLRPIKVGRTLPYMLLVYPGVNVPTKDVFGRLTRPSRPDVLTALSQLNKLNKKLEKGAPISEWGPLVFNRLEAGVLSGHPEVAQAKTILLRLGLQGVLMSGSGSSVYGFVGSQSEGEQVLRRLRAYPWKSYLTCFLG